jgi:hypothetical protein
MDEFNELRIDRRYALPSGRNDQAKIAERAEIESLR